MPRPMPVPGSRLTLELTQDLEERLKYYCENALRRSDGTASPPEYAILDVLDETLPQLPKTKRASANGVDQPVIDQTEPPKPLKKQAVTG